MTSLQEPKEFDPVFFERISGRWYGAFRGWCTYVVHDREKNRDRIGGRLSVVVKDLYT